MAKKNFKKINPALQFIDTGNPATSDETGAVKTEEREGPAGIAPEGMKAGREGDTQQSGDAGQSSGDEAPDETIPSESHSSGEPRGEETSVSPSFPTGSNDGSSLPISVFAPGVPVPLSPDTAAAFFAPEPGGHRTDEAQAAGSVGKGRESKVTVRDRIAAAVTANETVKREHGAVPSDETGYLPGHAAEPLLVAVRQVADPHIFPRSYESFQPVPPGRTAGEMIARAVAQKQHEERKSKRLNLLLQPSVLEDISKIAHMKRTSVNDLINTVLREYREAEAETVAAYEVIFGDPVP